MKKFSIKYILWTMIGISILMSSYIMVKRYNVEDKNNTVEIIADLWDFQDLSAEIQKPFSEVVNDLKGSGVTSVSVPEMTLERLKQRGLIAYSPFSDILTSYLSRTASTNIMDQVVKFYNANTNTLKAENMGLVLTQNKIVFDFLQDSLIKRTTGNINAFTNGNTYAILINKRVLNIEKVGLGFLESELQYADGLGFANIVPRPENYTNISYEDITKKIDIMKKYKAQTIIFGGNSVLGYDYRTDEKLDYTARKFSEKGKELVTAIIEKPAGTDLEKVQKGVTKFIQKTGYIATKVFSFDPNQLSKLSKNDIVDQSARAISQRNVRMIYIRPINLSDKDKLENYNDTLDAIKGIKSRVHDMNLKTGIAKSLSPIYNSMGTRILLSLGVIAACILFLCYIIEAELYYYILLMLGALCTFMIFLMPLVYNIIGDLYIKLIASISSVIFPSLGALYIIYSYKKYENQEENYNKITDIILESIRVLTVSIMISIIGGFIISSIMAESKYLLKLDIFRGVKLSFVLPLIIFVGLFIMKIGIYVDKNNKPLEIIPQMQKLLNTSVMVKYALIFVIVAIALTVLVIRSGNTQINITSDTELKFRTFLETTLVARPRTKELIAFPISMLLIYFAINKNKGLAFLTMIAALVGIEDIVNSFSHLRMPLIVSALSTGYSLISGVILGSILIFIYDYLRRLYVSNLNK